MRALLLGCITFLVAACGIDGDRQTKNDVVDTALNIKPEAKALLLNSDNIKVGAVITFDASASADANGDKLYFQWQWLQRPDGSVAEFSDTSAKKPQVTVDKPGDYVARLVVGDNVLASDPVDIRFTVTSSVMPLPVTPPVPIRNEFSVGVRVTGLTATLIIQNNETDTLLISSNDSFVFSQKLNNTDIYNVAIRQNPDGQICSISNASGQINAADVQDIDIYCTAGNVSVSVSGGVRVAPRIYVDSDVNDPFAAPNVSNNTPITAQQIPNFAIVQGFLTSTGTGRFPQQDRFAFYSDKFDVFRVVLQKNQTINLQVVDFTAGGIFQGDLDVELYDMDLKIIAWSDSETEYETISVPADGEYYISVYAYEGASKYTLSLGKVNGQGNSLSVTSTNFVPGQAIVQFKPTAHIGNLVASDQTMQLSHHDVSRASLASFESSKQNFVSNVNPKNFDDVLTIKNPKSYQIQKTLHQIKHLRQHADIQAVHPNYVLQSLRVPDDTNYESQWHYPAVKLPQAWDITLGNRVNSDVIVAVIDTGVYLAHPDFIGQLVDGYDFIRDRGNALDGDGIDNNPDDPGDGAQLNSSSWHGSHVAGTIAARSNDNYGVAGVAWGAKIMPVRVLGRDGATSYDLIQSVRFASGLSNDGGILPAQKADIINLSLGGGPYDPALQNVFSLARDAGVIVVAAAGNESIRQFSYPASYDGVVSVSATDFANNPAPYSNFGSRIDVAAPGGDTSADLNDDGKSDGVLSVIADDSSGIRKPSWAYYQGTSMASPHVAGVFALMRAVYPGITPSDIDRLLSAGLITMDLGSTGRDDIYGYGLIDALKAVQEAQKLANGGVLPAQSAMIVSDPAQLLLGLDSSATLILSNQGDETESIIEVSDNAPWLTVSAGLVDVYGLGQYKIEVDRRAMADSSYSANIAFKLGTGDTLNVKVSMQVGNVDNTADIGEFYILLVDEYFGTVDQVSPRDQGNGVLHFQFADVAPGSYKIVAGSDIDNDKLICQLAEICGGYPVINRLSLIDVINTDINGLDFTVDILANFGISSQSDNEKLRQLEGFVQGFVRLPKTKKQIQ